MRVTSVGLLASPKISFRLAVGGSFVRLASMQILSSKRIGAESKLQVSARATT